MIFLFKRDITQSTELNYMLFCYSYKTYRNWPLPDNDSENDDVDDDAVFSNRTK